MKATYVDHMGNDLRVVNSARVSFAKGSEPVGWTQVNLEAIDQADYPIQIPFLSEKDQKLIRYLAKHNHWTPFGHPQLTIHVKVPIFVARQLDKHQVGLVKNEVSRRYVDDEPEFYKSEWRMKAENVKQGSSEQVMRNVRLTDQGTGESWVTDVDNIFYQKCEEDVRFYETLISQGMAPEVARSFLPQSTYTEWYWTGSLAAFIRVCKLRLDSHAQKETRLIAEDIAKILKTIFPISYGAHFEEETSQT